MHEHLIFFDRDCPLCRKAIAYLIEIDLDQKIIFAPLSGQTAKDILCGPQRDLLKANSLILVENYLSTERRFWIRSKAILRVYWLIGHGWKLLGFLCFFPSFLGDFIYRKVAKHRHQFKLKTTDPLGPASRFLP